MRRLYIVPKSVWFAAAHVGLFHPGIGAHYIDLVPAGTEPTSEAGILAQMTAAGHGVSTMALAKKAFDQHIGDTTLILVCTDFASEGSEDAWHAHPSVAVLPSPTFEGNDALTKHIGSPTKRINPHHLTALESHPALGYKHGDTVLDLARKAAVLHPQVKLRAIL